MALSNDDSITLRLFRFRTGKNLLRACKQDSRVLSGCLRGLGLDFYMAIRRSELLLTGRGKKTKVIKRARRGLCIN